MQRRRRNEVGESLVELLVTISILGITIALLVGVLAGTIAASSSHRKHTTADIIARDVAEALKDRTVPFDESGNYPDNTWDSIDTAGYAVTLPVTRCWNGDSPATFGGCPTSGGLQLITISVTSNSKGENEHVSILKRSD